MLGGSTGPVARSPTDAATDRAGTRTTLYYVLGSAAGIAGLLIHSAFSGVAVVWGYFLYDEGERRGGVAVALLGLLGILLRIGVLIALA